MVKIKYPKDRKKFEEDYKKIFYKKNGEWYNFEKNIDCCVRRIFTKHKIKSLNDLLIAPFDVLLELFNAFPPEKIKKNKDGKKIYSSYDKYIKYFKYDGDNQQNISKFFMKNSKVLKLNTCYFCNIDYINSFTITPLELLNNAKMNILKDKVDGIGKEKAKKIIDYRKNKIITYQNLEEDKILTRKIIKKVKNSKIEANHFTLDHFLPKGKCPILSLSLYNFVPSCYACNSTFKGVDELLKTHLSPTSKDFSVDTDIKFKLYNKGDFIDEKFTLALECNKEVEQYVQTFKLRGRYKFHEKIAEDIIQKQKQYPNSKIHEMASLLGIPFQQIKNDIFGKELFDETIAVQENSFTKLKRDILKL